MPLRRRDTFSRAMLEYDDREASAERYREALLDDPMIQADLRLRSQLVRAEVMAHSVVANGRSRTTHITVRTNDPNRLSVGEELGCAARPGLRVRIESVGQRRGGITEIEMIAGKLPDGSSLGTQKVAADEVTIGDALMLCEAGLGKSGILDAKRVRTNQVLPWVDVRQADGSTRRRQALPPTHDPDLPLPVSRKPRKRRPADLLADARRIA